MKIYISGQITGLDPEVAMGIFEYAESVIAVLGHQSINPAKANPDVPGKRWAQYIGEDIEVLDLCDAIYMLPNWRQSKGARIEHHFCEVVGKPIFYAATEITEAGESNVQ